MWKQRLADDNLMYQVVPYKVSQFVLNRDLPSFTVRCPRVDLARLIVQVEHGAIG